MKNHILKFLRKNTEVLITLVFAVIVFTLWIFSTGEHDIPSLWLNLLASFVSSICTILVINNILKRQKEKEVQPLHIALYRDIQLFASRTIDLWSEMYVRSTKSKAKIEVNTLFSELVIMEIYSQLDLEGKPNVFPEQNWFVFIDNSVTDLFWRGNKILDRYVSVAEPELFQAIHHLINDSPFIGHLLRIKNIHNYDISEGCPRCPLLLEYTIKPTENDYKAIKTLFDWCGTAYTKLENAGGVYKIVTTITYQNCSQSSIMTDEKKQNCINKFEAWRNSETKV